MSSGSSAPPDYAGIAQRQAQANQQSVNAQTAANRPNQSNPFSTRTWTQGPNGQWLDSTTLNGPLGDLNTSLQQQAAQAMSQPFSLSDLPALTDGATARQQAIDAAYGDATKRLDPQFQRQEGELRNRLLGQGLVEGSEAYNNAMSQFGAQRNDAYNSALNSAIGQGTAAGQALFNQSMSTRQNALAEALRQRGQAFSELKGLQGLTQQQGFMGAGMAEAPDELTAASMADNAAIQRQIANQQFWAEIIGAAAQAGGALGGAAIMSSDERAKQNIEYVGGEAIPGVPLVRWNYLPEFGDPEQRWEGVLAQDLRQVAPEHVMEDEDGMLYVSEDFAPKKVSP